jgi:hypothetical protein
MIKREEINSFEEGGGLEEKVKVWIRKHKSFEIFLPFSRI